MKKKLIIAGVVLLVLAIGGYLGFQWYLNSHKAESEVKKQETTLKSFDDLEGKYVSEETKPVTSEIIFNIGGATATQGTFKKFSVVFEITEASKNISVEVDVSSIYTAEEMRDEHLKSDEFFHVEKFPKIIFSSNDIVKGDTSYIANGTIKFMGLTNNLSVPFNYVGQSNDDENVEIFEGKFDFDRVKYGMKGDSGAENNVTITFYCALRKQ
jgi:polyisoprenoid-binding protein YceI